MNSNNTQTNTNAATAATAATTPAASEQPQVHLNVTDIVNGTILLKVSIDRGTFKTEELNEVMGVYNKLSAFVQYVQETAKAESQAAGAAASEAAASETLASTEKSSKKTKKAKK